MVNMLKELYKKLTEGNLEAQRIHRNLDNLKEDYAEKVSQYIGMM